MVRVADAHNDLLLAVQHRRERGDADPFGDVWLPQLRAGGVVLQVLPLFTEEQFVGAGALARALEIVETARWIADRHAADVAIVETAADLRAVVDSGRIALVLALEGAEPIGSSLALVETFWRLGIRIASLTWNRRTMMADGIGETDTLGRLTRLGVEAVALMEQLGMVVDVSHLSAPGFAQLAAVATRPFLASHSSCRALCGHPRNLDDDQLRAVAAADGWVGINAFGPFIDCDAPSVGRYLDHVAHAAAVAGPDRVGLGTDLIDDLVRLVDPILGGALVSFDDLELIDDLRRPADLAALATALVERFGAHVGEAVASGNLVDFLLRALPRDEAS